MKNNINNYFIGLDIGTDSVGWCVSNDKYKVLKYKNNAMWGVSLFDSANQASERRGYRTTRRRYDRRQQRILLLDELFAKEISKIDSGFFVRRKESALLPDDRTKDNGGYIFDNPVLDKEYHEKYPTIHHLICELINNKEPHDIRLVYMAVAWILAHRGHFLLDVEPDNVDKVKNITYLIQELMNWFDSQDCDRPFDCNYEEFGEILKNEKRKQERERKFKELLWDGKSPEKITNCPVDSGKLIKLISGLKVNLSDIFCNSEYEEIEHNNISLSDGNFDEITEALSTEIDSDDLELVKIAKSIYDWGQLVNLLNGKEYISEAKKEIYEQHKNDLKLLKKIVKKYIPEKYNIIFRIADNKVNNYVKYSANLKDADLGNSDKFKTCSNEDFCKYIKSIIKDIVPNEEDTADFDYIQSSLDLNSFCPKQVTGENRVIPYQLYYCELNKILDNAKIYLPFLNESDNYGTIADKILSIMTFRIPYYVGPLVNLKGKDTSWIVRKSGEIYPWNFDEMVDKDKSEEEFIRRMTAKCTYVAGEDVLPKNSLLYCKFAVLNEINNIRINGVRLDNNIKQGIYNNVFLKYKKVTLRKIKDYLSSIGFFCEGTDKLDGIDISVKSSLKPYLDFRNLLQNGKLSENQVEDIISRITVTTDKKRLKMWIKDNYPLDDIDIRYVANLGYSDYGRLSKRFLSEIPEVDSNTGEVIGGTIIEQMWENSVSLMELLSDSCGFKWQLDKMNAEYYSEHPKSIEERLSEMYVPTAVRRSVIRTLDIVSEINKLTGSAPAKVFVEMARDHTNDQKGIRTVSRKDQVEKFLKSMPDTDELLKQLSIKSEGELRSDKLFLYFMQLGKCMYSGEPINIDDLGTKLYDIDHIYPQSKIKDDSIDNRVLVKSELNYKKGDIIPIDPSIQSKMHSFWDMLHKNGLISDKKYERLTRSTGFTDNELADFINRQLVETRQSTKAVTVLLKEMFPETEIVYVKAGIVSQFRQKYDMLKCREVNDLHHAKDAYLNIVMGQVYDTKFTKNPLNFIKENGGNNRNYSMIVTSLLNHDIQRGNIVAWKKDETLNNVKTQMAKNNIRFVRYSFCQKGGLFDQEPLRKGHGQIPRKKGLDINKYGAYQKSTITYYLLVKYKKGKKHIVSLIPVELRFAVNIKTLDDKIRYCADYVEQNLKSVLESVLLGGRKIKINTLFEIDGFRANLSCRTNNNIWFKGGMPLILPQKYENYVKIISSYYSKYNEACKLKANTPFITEYDKITSEENIDLFNILLEKLANTKYRILMPTPLEIIKNNKEYFCGLSVEQQTIALYHIIELFGCTTSSGKDLTLINGSKSSGILQISMSLNGTKRFSDIRIIDQSPTGLIEHRSENLLEL